MFTAIPILLTDTEGKQVLIDAGEILYTKPDLQSRGCTFIVFKSGEQRTVSVKESPERIQQFMLIVMKSITK